jgi:hypothetical protein
MHHRSRLRSQPAGRDPTAASALPRAGPRTVEIHKRNVMHVCELLGGPPFTREQILEINRAVASLAGEASEKEANEIAANLGAEFGWTACR